VAGLRLDPQEGLTTLPRPLARLRGGSGKWLSEGEGQCREEWGGKGWKEKGGEEKIGGKEMEERKVGKKMVKRGRWERERKIERHCADLKIRLKSPNPGSSLSLTPIDAPQ